jgi:ABC-type transport system involved in cytochrome c biogenesis ATPase subunit
VNLVGVAQALGRGAVVDGAVWSELAQRRRRRRRVERAARRGREAGQRRRLGLARLLLTARPLWLLDEPFAALDVDGKGLVARLIALHCGQGGMVIAATHEPLGLGNESLKL